MAGRFGVVSVTMQPAVTFGNPTQLPPQFRSLAPSAPRGFDLMPDGRLIGLVTPGQVEETGAREIRIVLNWFEELKRLVPVK